MPSLVLCWRKTCFAGDDLRFVCVLETIFRLIQLALSISLLVVTSMQKDHSENALEITLLECEQRGLLSSMASHGITFMYIYAYLGIILSIGSIFVMVPIYIISGRGTPTDAEPRRMIRFFCCLDMTVINIYRVFSFVFGVIMVIVLEDYCECLDEELNVSITSFDFAAVACPHQTEFLAVILGLVVTHAIDFAAVAILFLYFSCKIAVPASCQQVLLPSAEFQCKCCCVCCMGCASSLTCCLFGGHQAIFGDFGDFALVISNYFENNHLLDITPSDVLAGLVMLIRVQQEQRLDVRERLLSSDKPNSSERSNEQIMADDPLLNPLVRTMSSPDATEVSLQGNEHGPTRSRRKTNSHPKLRFSSSSVSDIPQEKREILSADHARDRYLISEGARYITMAEAMYTWLMYFVEHPIFGICSLTYESLRRCSCHTQENIVGDYIWKSHLAALEALSGLNSEDIVYASFKQNIKAVPYMIALDHEWKSVVIAIRGTLSLESLLADLTLKPEELTKLGEECGFDGKAKYCHKGMLDCTEWIYRDLMRHGKLQCLFGGEYKDYRLRIIGHSLGAGCAVLLSLFLRPLYPRVRCLAFSPPGCTVSANLAEECSKWVTAYVLDSDIIPRLSIESFEDLRNGVLEMICRIRIPKYQVRRYWGKDMHDKDMLQQDNSEILYKVEEVKDSEFKRQLDQFYEFQSALKEENKSNYVELCAPGQIIQLFRTKYRKKSLTSSSLMGTGVVTDNIPYVPRWLERTDLQTISISSHFMTDHNPVKVKKKILEVASNFGLAPPYSNVLIVEETAGV